MSNRRRPRVGLLAPSIVLGLAAGLVSSPPALAGLIGVDLAEGADVRIDAGPAESLAGVGDTNGDGFDDVLVGFNQSTYLVFGGRTGQVDLANLGGRGFKVTGHWDTMSVAAAGDVNGDGLDDLLIADVHEPERSSLPGEAYVIFGGAAEDVDLADLGDRGFRIRGAAPYDIKAGGIAGAGDVNGDGYDDVLVGSFGSSYVVLGRSTATADVELAAIGDRGFRIDHAGDWSERVAGAGDVNGDGYDDVLVEPRAGNNAREGSSYVVFGGSTANVDLAALGERGFRIDHASDRGGSVAGAGDVNGDGYDDVLVGALYADGNARRSAGSSFVVFGGSSADVDLAALGARGFRVDGAEDFDNSGASVAGAGDVNGDGLDDVLIGAPGAEARDRKDSGVSYVVLGGSTTDVDLADLGDRGFGIDGSPRGRLGDLVAGAGDVNGDGFADVLVAGMDGGREVHIVFGSPDAALTVKARMRTKKVRRTGRTELVRSIRVGTGQKARVTVKVLPKSARKTVTVKKTHKRVVVRTKKTPKKVRIRVRIASRGDGYRTRTWTRTWRTLGSASRSPGAQADPPVLLALGDSWAGGVMDREWYGYVNRLQDDLRLQPTCPGSDGAPCRDLQVRNIARGNATTASVLGGQLQAAVSLLRDRNGDRDPANDVVVTAVTVGGLDVFQPVLTDCSGAVTDTCRSTIKRVFAEYEANMTQILSALRSAAGADAEIVVTAYDNPIPYCYLSGLGERGAAVLEGGVALDTYEGLNDITRRVAADYRAKVAETFERLSGEDWVGGTDCVHPDASGHEKIANAFAKALGVRATRPGHVMLPNGKQTVKAQGGKARLTWRPVRRAKRVAVRFSKPGGTSYGKWRTQKKRKYVRSVVTGKRYRVQIRGLGPGGRGPILTVTVRS